MQSPRKLPGPCPRSRPRPFAASALLVAIFALASAATFQVDPPDSAHAATEGPAVTSVHAAGRLAAPLPVAAVVPPAAVDEAMSASRIPEPLGFECPAPGLRGEPVVDWN